MEVVIEGANSNRRPILLACFQIPNYRLVAFK